MIHIRFEGKSFDLPLRNLRLDANATEHQIKERVAQYFEVGIDRLESYTIDRPKNGNLIIRPEAVYG